MGSHSVHQQRHFRLRPDGAYDAEVELACGCIVRLVVPEERTALLEGGARRVAGKYPCPNGHPVKARTPPP